MPETQQLAIGSNIARYRRQAKLSGEELAIRAGNGLTRSVIANLENGRKADVTVRQLLALAFALSVSPTSLLFDLRDAYDLIELTEHTGKPVHAPMWLAFGWFGGQFDADELRPTDAQGEPRFPMPITDANRAIFYLLQERDRLLRREKALTNEIRNASNSFESDDQLGINLAIVALTEQRQETRAQLFTTERQLRENHVDLAPEHIAPGLDQIF